MSKKLHIHLFSINNHSEPLAIFSFKTHYRSNSEETLIDSICSINQKYIYKNREPLQLSISFIYASEKS